MDDILPHESENFRGLFEVLLISPHQKGHFLNFGRRRITRNRGIYEGELPLLTDFGHFDGFYGSDGGAVDQKRVFVGNSQ